LIVDTSAIIAILAREPAADALAELLVSAPERAIAAPTIVELQAVLEHRGKVEEIRAAESLLRSAEIEVADFTVRHAEVARQAYRDYGRASGHPARLNLGDCFAYAMASVADEPLLFVGDDFTHTDVRPAYVPPTV
jgi:ribonuclease VapC